MRSEFETQLLQEIEELKRKVSFLEGKKTSSVPTYQYSKIRDRDLTSLFEIERNINQHRFDEWFDTTIDIDPETEAFLAELLDENAVLMDSYGEEDLKINFIGPLLKRVRFASFERRIRDFYEVSMTYATSRFVFNGTVDFVVAEGLVESKRPYFFIQEFKRSEEYGNPRPQLLAELISALELNAWITIKGAYVIGGSWHFVILEKLATDTYQYFISQNFDATKLADLKRIYQHLVYVKQEIISMITLESRQGNE
jgi:ketosteroid isomerase-like protein